MCPTAVYEPVDDTEDVPRYTLLHYRASDAAMGVNLVKGLSVDGDELKYYFDAQRVCTVDVVRVGDEITFRRDK